MWPCGRVGQWAEAWALWPCKGFFFGWVKARGKGLIEAKHAPSGTGLSTEATESTV